MDKHLRGLMAVLLSASLCCVAARAQSDAEKVLLEKARALETLGRLDLAQQNWQQVLLSDPNNTEALAGVARDSMSAGKPQQAQEFLDRLRAINPSDPRIAQIQAVKPKQEIGQQLRHAGQLAQNGRYEEAMNLYRQVYADKPPAGDMALAYYETEAATPDGRSHAIAGLRDLIRKYPKDSRYESVLGRILTYEPKTRGDGIAMLKRHPNDPEANEALRQALTWESGNPASASEIRGYLKSHPDAELEGQLNDTVARQLKQNSGMARTPAERAAFSALAANKLDLALRLFNEIHDREPANPRALAGLGFLSMKQKNFAAAVGFLESSQANGAKSAVVDSALATSRFWLAMTEGADGLTGDQMDAALAKFRKALEMRPTSVDALRGLAGTLLRAQQPAEAAQAYTRLIRIQPNSPDGWRGLVMAQSAAGDPRAALDTAARPPATVRAALAADPQYLSTLASAYQDVGDDAGRQRILAQGMELPFPQNGKGMSAAEQMGFAELLMQAERYQQAAGIYHQVIELDPTNLAAYEALTRAQHAMGNDALALATVEQMPPDALAAAERSAGFLGTIAAIYQAQGKLDIAQMFLEQSLALYASSGQVPAVSSQLQLASIYATRGNVALAYPIYQRILHADPKRTDAWLGLFSALNESKRDREALTELQEIPPAVRTELNQEPRFLQVLASIYTETGDVPAAFNLVRQAVARYQQKNIAPPADLIIQYCYMLLNAGDEQTLYAQLMRLGSRQDLTPQQRSKVQIVWTAWSVRRASVAAKSGNMHRARQILDAANRAFPSNADVQKALAAGYQQAGEAKRAEAFYLQMDWTNAKVDDYRAALGAALQARDLKQAALWLDSAVQQFPEDPKILQQAAQYEQARGDNRKATEYYQQSLRAMGPPDPAAAIMQDVQQPLSKGPTAAPQSNPGPDLIHLLSQGMQPGTSNIDQLGDITAQTTPPSPPPTPANYLPGQIPVLVLPDQNDAAAPARLTPPAHATLRLQPALKKSHPSAQTPKTESPQNPQRLGDYNPPQGQLTPGEICALNRSAETGCELRWGNANGWTVKQASWVVPRPLAMPALSSLISQFASPRQVQSNPTLRDQVEQQLEGLEGGFSPWIGGTAMVSTRSGQPGFDHFVVFSEPLEASGVIDNFLRATIIVKPVLLDAGVATGLSTLLQGTNGAGCGSTPACTIYTQTASGIGGEVQLRTNNFGVTLGSSPRGFLVSNFIGSLYANPGAGPLTFTFTRDSVLDTQLSYSGLVNTGAQFHNIVWGGVVANAFQGQYAKTSDHSGYYIQGGGQYITGNNVETNARADGDAGAYWHVASWAEYGTLTFGMNMFAMHYEHNLRYFTYGQGGYFSPDSYLLANIPVRFDGHSGPNFHYRINASLGVQAFQEDAAPYYPLNPTLNQTPAGPLMYPTRNSVSGNYLVDAEAAYRISEHWFAGGFLNANNSRDYNSVNIGFYVRYMFRGQSPTEEGPPTGIFPVNGLRPMQVP